MNQKQESQSPEASPISYVLSPDSEQLTKRSKNSGKPPKVPLRPQIKLWVLLKGMGDKSGSEGLEVVGYLFLT